jgi:hypothetical protein
MRISNWSREDVSNLAVAQIGIQPFGVANAGLAGPDRPMSIVIAQGALGVPEAYYSETGRRIWTPWGPVPGGGSTLPTGVAADGAGGVAQTLQAPADQICISGAPGAPWVLWPFAAAPGLFWAGIACDGDNVAPIWAIVNTTSAAVYWAPATGAPFVVAATPPGFAASWPLIRHSGHHPDDLYPGDPGNEVFLILTNTEASSSADGDTWTAAVAHGMTNVPEGFAYSRQDATWIAIERSNPGSRIAVSVDNGATWVETTPIDSGIDLTVVGAWARIACDGYGHWAVLESGGPGTHAELHVSVDNGETWRRVYPEENAAAGDTIQLDEGGLWYGNGAFHLLTSDGAGTFYGAISLRALE